LTNTLIDICFGLILYFVFILRKRSGFKKHVKSSGENMSEKKKQLVFFTIVLFSVAVLIPSKSTIAQTTYSQSSGTTTLTGQTFTSSTNDLSAVKVTGGTLNLSSSTISSSGNTSSTDNSSFYGLNAVILAYTSSGAAIINSSGNTITSTGTGANGIFAYGTASATSENDIFFHTGDGGHAIMCSGGGTITVVNDSAVTSGSSSSTIATDRGSGTITVTGGYYAAKGNRSAAVYSTGVITCTDATLVAEGAEALVVEGSNSIILNNCSTKCTYNKWGALLYQSMSGDADGVDGYLYLNGGNFTYTGTQGGMFYNTNSTAHIYLNSVTLENSCDTLVRCIKGSWGGSSASSGGITRLYCDGQTLSGLIHVDANSTLYDTLYNSSNFTGVINNSNTAKLVSLVMDASSTWTLTKDSHLTIIINSAGISGTTVTNITGNGHNVYYNSSNSANSYLNAGTYSLVGGGYLLPEGTTDVEDETSIPTDWGLSQNYPNPFNPSTTINYQIPSSGQVTLQVFDVLGREIETLVNGVKQAGSYSVTFNAQNLPSGVYVYRIRGNNFVQSKKMLLIK
jgi:hypothetical protein